IRNRSQSICMQRNTVSLIRLYLIRNIRKLLCCTLIRIPIIILSLFCDKDERTGKGWANGDGSGGNARDGEGEKRGERTAERKIEREREREREREKDREKGVCICESGGRVVVEERGSVVERPSRCGHELRRSGNVGSV
ncbi:hypothetical protein ALC56_09655, partial [Trachymyrmex septentrionalis]